MKETVLKNLLDAFAGESQANRKYLFYVQKAEEEEGYSNVAKLFRTAAEAETIHARGEFKAADKLKDTIANLEDGISGETYEYTEMYPPFVENAKKEEEKEAARIFGYAKAAEEVHANLYKEALEAVKKGKDIDTEYYLCPICGNIEKKIPGRCPICGAKGDQFKKIG